MGWSRCTGTTSSSFWNACPREGQNRGDRFPSRISPDQILDDLHFGRREAGSRAGLHWWRAGGGRGSREILVKSSVTEARCVSLLRCLQIRRLGLGGQHRRPHDVDFGWRRGRGRAHRGRRATVGTPGGATARTHRDASDDGEPQRRQSTHERGIGRRPPDLDEGGRCQSGLSPCQARRSLGHGARGAPCDPARGGS